MPSYRVLEPGFFDGKTYGPKEKRNVLTVDKPFSKEEFPEWLEPLTVAPKKVGKAAPKAIVEFSDGDVETL